MSQSQHRQYHCDEQKETSEPLAARDPKQAPAPAMAVPEWSMMLPAESEPQQAVVTSPIYCHKQEETTVPLVATEPK